MPYVYDFRFWDILLCAEKDHFADPLITAGSRTLRKGNGDADQTIIAHSNRGQLRPAVGSRSVYSAGGGGADPPVRRQDPYRTLCTSL